MTRPKPVRGALCPVCKPAGDAVIKEHQTLMPEDVRFDANPARVRGACGYTDRYTEGRLTGTVRMICIHCGTRVEVETGHDTHAAEQFMNRVHDAIDPATPEQKRAAAALSKTAATLRAEAHELELKARKLSRGES